ncbi:MAG: AI-2E family transporter [Phycisphaerales bacterium]|nr:AI-2E family transporter [Phycisphaerales bacterium]
MSDSKSTKKTAKQITKKAVTKKTRTKPDWSKLHLWQMQPVRDVLVGLSILLLILLAQKLSVVTVPLILAILLAYLFEPVIRWSMKKFTISRRTSVIGIIAGVVLFIIVPATLGTAYGVAQLTTFATNTTNNITAIDKAYDQFPAEDQRDEAHAYLKAEGAQGGWIFVFDKYCQAKNEVAADKNGETNNAKKSPWVGTFDLVSNWIETNQSQIAQAAAGVGMETVRSIFSFVGALFGLGFMGFLTAFFFFFTATEWIGLQRFGSGLLPDKNRTKIMILLVKFDRVISGFIRGRITIAVIQSVVFSIGFFLIGVPGAFILGPIVAFLSIVPYLALVGVPIAVVLLLLQGYADFRGAIWWVIGAPTALYFLGQALDDYILTPKIQGKSTGMDTPTILFASLAGGALFGIFGMLIAIPLAACAKILIQEIFWPKFKDWAEGRASDPLPIDG